MLGDTDQILGGVPQNAQIIQGQKNVQQGQAQDRANVAQAPSNAAAKEGAVDKAANEANQITITPQMAKGLKSMTGQSWDQTVGTKWKPEVFTAVTTGMAQAKYHQDVLSGKIDIEKAKEDSAKAKQEQATEDKKTLEDVKSQHAKELQDLKDKHAAERKKMAPGKAPGAGKSPPDPQTQGRQLLDAINKATKSGDDANKQSAVENYNKFASEHGLSAYKDDPGFLDKVGGLIKGLVGKGDGGGDKVADYLKKNGIKDTPANRKWAESKANAD